MRDFDIFFFHSKDIKNTTHNLATLSSGTAAIQNIRRYYLFSRVLKPDASMSLIL